MPSFGNAEHYARAREVLAAADYTEQGVGKTLGGVGLLSIPLSEIPPWLRATQGLSPHETLLRLFHLGSAVPEQAARRALQPMSLEDWIAAELLAPPKPDGSVAPRVKLLPVLDGVFAADMPQLETTTVPCDYVMPPGAITVQLAQAMIARRSRRTLDIGTGSGALACVAAGHSDLVVATDKSPRAVDFARFSARLNGLQQIECVAGDLFQPVAGQRFDLIVSNPPFVITPNTQLLFRDSGMRGDEFCRELLRTAAEHLEEGGFCQVNCNYARQTGRPWQDGLAAWFDGLGCDVLVWVDRTEAIASYAMTWIISTETQDPSRVPQLFDQWMQYYDQQQIEAVSYLLVNIRRRGGGTNWTAVDEYPRKIVGPCGDDVLRGFTLREFLAAHQLDAALLQVPFRLSEDARIEQEHAMTAEGLRPLQTRLHLAGGIRFALGIDPNVAGLLARCNGDAPLGELIGQLAASLGLETGPLTAAVFKVVRPLIERGVLLPVEQQGAGSLL